MHLSGSATLDEDHLQELWAKTYIPNPAVLSLLGYLQDNLGIQTGIVMNEDRWRFEYVVDRYNIGRYFSIILASFEVGAVKPDRTMYEALLAKSSRIEKPSRVLYVDDRQSHVDAAIACGIQGHLYINAGNLSTFIADLIDTGSLVKFQV